MKLLVHIWLEVPITLFSFILIRGHLMLSSYQRYVRNPNAVNVLPLMPCRQCHAASMKEPFCKCRWLIQRLAAQDALQNISTEPFYSLLQLLLPNTARNPSFIRQSGPRCKCILLPSPAWCM